MLAYLEKFNAEKYNVPWRPHATGLACVICPFSPCHIVLRVIADSWQELTEPGKTNNIDERSQNDDPMGWGSGDFQRKSQIRNPPQLQVFTGGTKSSRSGWRLWNNLAQINFVYICTYKIEFCVAESKNYAAESFLNYCPKLCPFTIDWIICNFLWLFSSLQHFEAWARDL